MKDGPEILNDTELDPVLEFDRNPLLARIETDRYCDGCGYNLRTQPVRRDPRTQLLLSRCSECGRFHAVREAATVGRVWLQRLGTLLLFIWILFILLLCFGLCAAQVGLTMGTLEELTTFQQVTLPITNQMQPNNPGVTQVIRYGGTTTIISGIPGVTTQSATYTTYRKEIRNHRKHDREFVWLMNGLGLTTGFVLLLVIVVVMHHWRRWVYLIPAVLVPLACGGLSWYIWWIDCEHLLDWATPKILNQTAASLAGGFIAILLGRPFARLLATILLPGKLRQVLAFLWLADGKSPPRIA